ncbi:MAG: ChaN family lipoprotein, partial [Rhodospirillales bacterium]|nr:ChaN family lipoprotein [Rhodospirillales bacterium]
MYRFALLLCLSLGACAGPQGDWVSPLDQGHPLAGRIWQVSPGRFVEPTQVEQAAEAADFVLAGEKHDNLDHHLLQARLLKSLIRAGRHPA